MILSRSVYVKVHFDSSSISMVLSNMRQCERIHDRLLFSNNAQRLLLDA
jgi:hypothetical protein